MLLNVNADIDFTFFKDIIDLLASKLHLMPQGVAKALLGLIRKFRGLELEIEIEEDEDLPKGCYELFEEKFRTIDALMDIISVEELGVVREYASSEIRVMFVIKKEFFLSIDCKGTGLDLLGEFLIEQKKD